MKRLPEGWEFKWEWYDQKRIKVIIENETTDFERLVPIYEQSDYRVPLKIKKEAAVKESLNKTLDTLIDLAVSWSKVENLIEDELDLRLQ